MRENLDGEEYELLDNANVWSRSPHRHRMRTHYRDGNVIDWWQEESAERERAKEIHSKDGLRGILAPLLEAAKMWFVIVATGIGVGVAGGWLDMLVKWLGDLKEGRCAEGIFYNSVACCSGLDPGEVCHEWQSWSQYLGVESILGQSSLQSLVYIALSVAFAASSALLVVTYAPYAFHTGIPEIKAILGGYVLDSFLSSWTLLIKALGLALSVASGLSLGKEGPLVHVSCCMAFLLSRLFKQFRDNEAHKRKLLAAAAAAGVSVAFGSPLGGVLFGLEELDTFANESDVMWRGFVTSVIAAVALQYVDPFGTKKLVLFQVTNGGDTWRAFELIPWLFLGVIGGVLGALLIKLNVAAAVYRRHSILHQMPILEVVGVTAITAAVSYLIRCKFDSRVQSSELVANLFQECDPTRGDFHGLCNPSAMWENIFLLTLTAMTKIGFTAWTFGMMVPAGIFLPTIAIGASLGRAVGLMTQGLHRAYPKAWIFSACPPDPSVRCVSPGFYAVIGASAMLGGVTRMTISLVVILFELTGALSHVLPIMIAVMVSKWVADAFGKEGIYSIWIAMRRYPWLAPVEYHDKGEVAGQLMVPAKNLVVVQSGEVSLGELSQLVKIWEYQGFPAVGNKKLLGFVAREKLKAYIELDRKCSFSQRTSPSADMLDLSALLEDVLQLRKDLPLELVVSMFRKLNLRHIMFTQAGELTGMIAKTDIVALSTAHFPHTAALAEHPVG
ncbi:chloride channel [Heterobasidion irregulare TC 32-1]|uniref:Chloride channel n=1 Tax=Heterobasidion irregulare (strain TC 32-1) TaxID=747525 RepID=W4K079_HETIT|nr:chloride channel [Heterobasidion irregulare TC 32-1]ETW79134.1 chloride channel [Heterobasidion irregulare TC 32-1]